MTIVDSDKSDSRELSLERLTTATKNFSVIPDRIGGKTEDTLYAFKQCVSTLSSVTVKGGERYSFTQVFSVTADDSKIAEEIEKSKEYFDGKTQKAEEEKLGKKYAELFSVRTVKTNNYDFDKFINGFLPLEMYWVSSLDRGWPTGMRGVRDAANDFEGMLCYPNTSYCTTAICGIVSKTVSASVRFSP